MGGELRATLYGPEHGELRRVVNAVLQTTVDAASSLRRRPAPRQDGLVEGLDTRSEAFDSEIRTMLQSEIEAALVDPEREPPELDGVPGWRRLQGGAPHPEDLRDIVDAVLKVTRPERVLLFGSGARGEMTDDSDIDIMVIDEAPGGTPKLKLAIGNALPMGLRWTDVLVLTPAGLRKRLHEWEDETLAEVLGEARTLYERSGG